MYADDSAVAEHFPGHGFSFDAVEICGGPGAVSKAFARGWFVHTLTYPAGGAMTCEI